jgi:hypothetical protein
LLGRSVAEAAATEARSASADTIVFCIILLLDC